MKLPKEAVIEFQELFKKRFGIVLDFEQSEARALNFLALLAVITKVSTNENEKLHTNTK